MAAAQREVWTGTELRRLLAEKAGLELSSTSVSALFTKDSFEAMATLFFSSRSVRTWNSSSAPWRSSST